MLPQLTDMGTAHHAAQEVVNIGAGQVVFWLHLFGEAVVPGGKPLLFPQLGNIHQAKGTAAVISLYLVIESQRPLVVFRRDQQIEFLGVQISLHRISPVFLRLRNLQDIGQNINCNTLTAVLFQLRGNSIPELEQSSGIILDVFTQICQGRLFPVLFPLEVMEHLLHLVGRFSNRSHKLGGSLLCLLKGSRLLVKYLFIAV